MTPFVVMRSHNDMPLIAETLVRLHDQDGAFELICLDNESHDGTLDELRKYTNRIVNIPQGSYVPGKVLNLGMELTTSKKVVFLNSDCSPQDSQWLKNLLRGFDHDGRIAAVFGRQIPRPDCHPLLAKDTEETYGDGSRQRSWRHCFSMASSAISRPVWKSRKFNEDLRYSEDIDWTWRMRQAGYEIRYVANSVVMHSHNYTWRQFYRRHYGEGRAEASIFPWSSWEASLVQLLSAPLCEAGPERLEIRPAKGTPGTMRVVSCPAPGPDDGTTQGVHGRPEGEKAMTHMYSGDGSIAFNERLHETLLRVADQVEEALGGNLVALVLGGGYGRGEGGVVQQNGVERPYNDLDFTLLVARKSRVKWKRLRDIGEYFAKELEIHVDFSRPLTLADVERWPHWLMWYDLLNGHVVLRGVSDILTRHAPSKLQEPLPAIEGTRLLLNRGTGLLWALRVVRGIESSPDEDFVRRNYYKCALALGDALLIGHRSYTTAYRGRDRLVAALERSEPNVAAFHLGTLYDEALRFKFRPDRVDGQVPSERALKTLAQAWGSVFLHVETVRTGRAWPSFREYVLWKGTREADQHGLKRCARNVVRNLQLGRLSWRYPREALYARLPVLLGLVEGSVRDWPQETGNYLRVWDRFN